MGSGPGGGGGAGTITTLGRFFIPDFKEDSCGMDTVASGAWLNRGLVVCLSSLTAVCFAFFARFPFLSFCCASAGHAAANSPERIIARNTNLIRLL